MKKGRREREKRKGDRDLLFILNADCGIMGPTGATDGEEATEATTEGAERMFAIPSLVLLVALLSTLL